MTTVFDEIAELTAQEAADMAAEYKALSDAIAVTEKRHASLKAQLKAHVARTGEPLHVEGVGTLILQPRSGPTTWDVKALAENDPATFHRLTELGALTVNKSVADALEKAGQVTGFRGYGHAGQSDPALVWEKVR